MNNPTQFTSLGRFDSDIPESAVQKVYTYDKWVNPSEEPHKATVIKWMYSNNIFKSDSLKHRRVSVEVQREDSTCYQHIATGTYYVDYTEKTSMIGSITVTPNFQKRGYGRQMKKTIENHLEQEPQTEQYTAIVSAGGEALIDPYPYEYITTISEDVDIYRKTL